MTGSRSDAPDPRRRVPRWFWPVALAVLALVYPLSLLLRAAEMRLAFALLGCGAP